MADQKFVVAKGCSFVGSGKVYSEGDEITAAVFGDNEKGKARFKSFQEGKNPKIIPATGAAKEEPKKLERKELEALALKSGMKQEEFKSLKDDELETKLKEAGAIK